MLVTARPIAPNKDECYQQFLEPHHYLGAIPKIGQTVRYVAQYDWYQFTRYAAIRISTCRVQPTRHEISVA